MFTKIDFKFFSHNVYDINLKPYDINRRGLSNKGIVNSAKEAMGISY